VSVYRQAWTYVEDDYGTVTVVFAVSDTYSELFDLSSAVDVDVFLVSKTKNDLDVGEGILVEDEIEFDLAETAAESQDDWDAIAFTLDAQDAVTIAKRRFCALFIQPVDIDAPTIDEADFVGVIRPKMSAEDLQWNDAAWGTAPAPLRVWKVTASPFFNDTFDQLSMKDLIYGHGDIGDPINTEYVKGIDATWESNNVADKMGYFSGVAAGSSADRKAKFAKITSLNDFMERITLNLVDTLDARGFGTYTVNLLASPLDFTLSPARFRYDDIGGKISRYVQSYFSRATPPYQIKTGDAVTVQLGDIGFTSHLWISYFLVKPEYDTNPPNGSPKEYGFENVKTYTAFLYALAANTAMYVEFRYTSPTELNISFKSHAGIIKHQVFAQDATRADIDTGPTPEEERRYYGMSFWLASEGPNEYTGAPQFGWYASSVTTQLKKDGNRTMLSISPTLRNTYYANDGISYTGTAQTGFVRLPHNARFYDDDVLKAANDPRYDAQGLTTALYVMTTGNGEYGLASQDLIHLPAAALHVVLDGNNETFYSLSEYLNRIYGRDALYYETEYRITVPFICSFRKAQDGSHADDDGGRGRWQNLELGCTFDIDGVEYVIVGIERDFKNIRTDLRLHVRSRFDFASSTGVGSDEAAQETNDFLPDVDVNNVVLSKTFGEEIRAGDYVTLRSDGKVYRSRAHDEDYSGLYGVALQDGFDLDLKDVQIEGVVTNANYAFDVGKRVHVRTTTVGTPNVSTTHLQSNDGTENMFAEVGLALNTTTLKIEPGYRGIYPPLL